MASVEDAVRSQTRNIEQATGRSLDEWVSLVKASGLEQHRRIVEWLKAEHGFSHGNANLVALTARRAPVKSGDDGVDAIYAGPRTTLRPFHDRVIELVRGFGPDVGTAPKQAYVSLRRSKQFGTVGPGRRVSSKLVSTSLVRSQQADCKPLAGCALIGSGWRPPKSSTLR